MGIPNSNRRNVRTDAADVPWLRQSFVDRGRYRIVTVASGYAVFNLLLRDN